MTVIIAGPVYVDPADRDRLVDGFRVVVERARAHPGCLDVSISPDSVDPRRVNILEHWESEEVLDAWRAVAPHPDAEGPIDADGVRKHVVAWTGRPFDQSGA
ncbi:antibiotic biosynthesis monooxygenase [Amycolatopsis sp. NPDC051045]|uniref:putative quinol monooxygenase n=1 Tax=Amycolatopsis sp. NPDC051045 TaxID=3156922 RepID=UPI0034229835